MKSYFLRHSSRLLAAVPAYIVLPTFPCLLLASTSSLAAAATTAVHSQPVDTKHVAAGRTHHPSTQHHPKAIAHKGEAEQITVTRSRAQRHLSTPGTVNVISGKELRSLHLESPKDIAAFTPGVTATNAVSGSHQHERE
ncbi:Plug domain-containing protein [Acetobacter sicerae]|uniref:Plug domain-containing protein n=1 Tax=Acetobacter sicerae TaxID=85325 RepID=A0ABS8VP73_9PROT|nr:Plug domain-containing protein [Acetobacter sicerae]MCE0742292.1 Plug domain-containing protein [Acetobacter sicerae]